MTNEQISKLEMAILNMEEKKSRIYFLVQDTKGNAKASVKYIYQMAMSLKKSGYNAIILHEKPDYFGVSSWLDESYMNELEHKPIEGTNLEVSPEDLIVVPELYGFIMEQIKKLPCGKIVLSQSYDYIFDTLQPGDTWSQFGFLKCITTSEKQKEYLENKKSLNYNACSKILTSLKKEYDRLDEQKQELSIDYFTRKDTLKEFRDVKKNLEAVAPKMLVREQQRKRSGELE